MKPSAELFDLVKSLSKSEKRFFKLSSSLQTGEKNYLQIFDAIEKQSSYDEAALKKQFAKETFVKHFPSEKNHLYKTILKSLRGFHADNSINSVLKQEIKNVEILYDYNNNLAEVNDIKNSKLSTVNIEKNVQDLISTFYFLRNHFDVKSLKINDFIRITIFFDAENYPFKMKFLGYENIKTKFGEINCLKFRPYIESGRVFSDSESLTLWVSNDKNKLPIKIEAGLRIGSIEADLEEFRGLKHPFKVNVNE